MSTSAEPFVNHGQIENGSHGIGAAWCEERTRLDQELRMLLRRKSDIRQQVAGQAVLQSERRATLLSIEDMIDDLLALSGGHHKHCLCEVESL